MDTKTVNEHEDYRGAKDRVTQFLESKHVVVVATSLDDRVTARTVTFAMDGLDILFMSWGHHTKCVQIRGNPRVAVCRDNVQIEGVAEILGSPLDEKNQRYAEIYREKLPRDFEAFARVPGMVLVKVHPTQVVTFFPRRQSKYGYVYLEHLDLASQMVAIIRPEEERV